MSKATKASDDRSIQARIRTLKLILDEMEEDVVKHIRGQKAAGTRIRKAFQEIRTEAQGARVQILKEQKSLDQLRQDRPGRSEKYYAVEAKKARARARGASTRLDLGLA